MRTRMYGGVRGRKTKVGGKPTFVFLLLDCYWQFWNVFWFGRGGVVWYEIARYDHSFERGMDNTMAEYILQDNGKVFVLNTGWKNGKFKVAEGKAVYKDPVGEPGAMKVSFFWFFYSEYNVMLVDENYQISLVGSKSDNYLWILSRTPEADPDLLKMVLSEAESRGYDTSKLIWVDQSRNK